MTKKTDDKVTEAGAVELDENELDNVTGGASYLKLGDIKGESFHKMGDFDAKKGISVRSGKGSNLTVGNKQEPYLKNR